MHRNRYFVKLKLNNQLQIEFKLVVNKLYLQLILFYVEVFVFQQ